MLGDYANRYSDLAIDFPDLDFPEVEKLAHVDDGLVSKGRLVADKFARSNRELYRETVISNQRIILNIFQL